ncbi:MAG: hypothetical protein RIK87_18315 [Fuerstiella sp.]
MRQSSDFHVGTVLLLTGTLIIGGLAAAFLYPLLRECQVPATRSVATSTEQETLAVIAESQKYAEFYPTQTRRVSYQTVQRERPPLRVASPGRRAAGRASAAVQWPEPPRSDSASGFAESSSAAVGSGSGLALASASTTDPFQTASRIPVTETMPSRSPMPSPTVAKLTPTPEPAPEPTPEPARTPAPNLAVAWESDFQQDIPQHHSAASHSEPQWSGSPGFDAPLFDEPRLDEPRFEQPRPVRQVSEFRTTQVAMETSSTGSSAAREQNHSSSQSVGMAVPRDPAAPAGSGTPVLPSGSVYAPITVNIDGSLLAQQMSRIEDRIEGLRAVQNQPAVSATYTESQRQPRRVRRPSRPNKGGDGVDREAIADLEAELREVVGSVRLLTQKTDLRLEQIAEQSNRARVAQQVIEAYQKALDQAERRVVQAPPANPPVRVAVTETDFDDVSPQAGRQPNAPAATSEAWPPVDPRPQETAAAEERPSRKQFSAEDPSADVAPFPRRQASVQHTPVTRSESVAPAPELEEFSVRVESPKISVRPSMPVPAAPVLRSEEREEPRQDFSSPDDSSSEFRVFQLDDPEPADAKKAAVPKPMSADPAVGPNARINTDRSGSASSFTRPMGKLNPVPVPPESVATQTPTPTPTPTRAAAVGFEHVYRFEVETVEKDASPEAASGPVCPHCGKVHSKAVRPCSDTTISQSRPAPSRSAYSSHSPSPSTTMPRQAEESRRSGPARTGARGTNRHVNRTADGVSSPGILPRLMAPSMTTEHDEPSVLHRISSTVRNWGRDMME